VADIHIPQPLTARAVYNSLESVHRQIVLKLQAEGKTTDWTPAWYAHLPSGEKIRIRWFGIEGSLVLLRTPEALPVVLAPDAVAITIEPLPEDAEGVPIEFLELDEND
jgi:hypothetical protein